MNSETQKLLDDFILGRKAQLEEKDARIKELEDKIITVESMIDLIKQVLQESVK